MEYYVVANKEKTAFLTWVSGSCSNYRDFRECPITDAIMFNDIETARFYLADTIGNRLNGNINNYQIIFSVPTLEEMIDEFEKDEDGFFRKRNEVEKYTEVELLQFIENTYRNVTIKADISICIGSEKVGMLIIPTKPDKDY